MFYIYKEFYDCEVNGDERFYMYFLLDLKFFNIVFICVKFFIVVVGDLFLLRIIGDC